MDFQLAFRQSSEVLHGLKVYMTCGFLRSRVGGFDAEQVSHLRIRAEGSDIRQIAPSGLVSKLALSNEHRLSCGVGDLLKQSAWRLPVDEGLSLFLRETRVDPHRDNYEVFSVVGMLLVNPDRDIDEDVIHAFAGPGSAFSRPDLARQPEGGLIQLSRGMAMDSVLKQPLWGFGDEPVGLWSTLELGVCDLLDRYNALVDRGCEDTEAEAELAGLSAKLAVYGLPGPGRTDDVYKRVREYLAENHSELVSRPSGEPRTKAEIETMRATMAEALQASLVASAPCFR